MLKEFKKLLGIKEYNSVIKILKTIGPDSRTHRISLFIAGILRYALEQSSNDPKEGSLEEALRILEEEPYNEGEENDLVLVLINELCVEAGMNNFRESSRGEQYSIAENAFYEFTRWYNMPWED